MRFAALGSGSRGNSWLVEAGRTRVLIDCGFGPRETACRLLRLGVEPESICAVAVTHDHSDHLGGVMACVRCFGWSVCMTQGTAYAVRQEPAAKGFLRIESHATFQFGDLQLQPFTVPHDAREPVQFIVTDGEHRLCILTDAGHVTPHMIETVDGCDALVLECNHDLELLRTGDYPYDLKQRITSRWGHLDNGAAAELLAAIDRTRLRQVIAAHLSAQNNRPELATTALAAVLGCTPDWVGVADQKHGLAWRSV
jgi:phosphoribosyl 1,2-cyclic phosphodiesterase